MAGKAKRSLSYAGWSVDIFDNDTKIDRLLDAQGWLGFSIYFYLCQRAFGSEGYFYRWGYDDCATTARKMGGGIGSGTVHETVGYCLQIGLFDKGLFDKWGVLTSRGIQRSYWAVAKTRRDKSVSRELWLLDLAECDGLVFVPLNSDMSATNDHSSATNGDMSATNDTVVKCSKVKYKNTLGRFTPPSAEEVNAYCQSRNNGLSGEEFVDFYASKGWMIGKNKMKDWKAAVRTWEWKRGQKHERKDLPAKRGAFNNFRQNDYDFDQIEKEMIGE